ncbi:MAG: CDP-diacylglycerol pyrophosphatase [Caulobacteraceae bacterium]|nr:CDP-diacylglycerol pyrophosphatase [Caulobacteraceae bacterium]
MKFITVVARAWVAVLGAIALGALILTGSPASADHPGALWRVVHGLCLRDMAISGRPPPCLAVNRQAGYAVVPDLRRPTQVLLVPTTRIGGIESPQILAPDAVNYWQAAWDERRWVERRAGRSIPRDRVGLAINSVFSRSQNQLHIHVDCVRPDVRRALMENEAVIGSVWAPLPVPLAGRWFTARRLSGDELGQRNPFVLLARGDPVARRRMPLETLAVIGATFSDGSSGFYLLSDHADFLLGDTGFAEGLLDHRCAVLRQP